MKNIKYEREKVLKYAKRWAYDRNPQFYNFDNVGGDCTSFVSQCILAGSNVMNYDKNNGWYYINGNKKSPSWTGVEFLYQFLINNKSVGPYAKEVSQNKIELGDIAQISFDGQKFAHSLVVVKIDDVNSLNGIYIASHTFDSYNKKISEYGLRKIRFIHINGVRNW